MSETLLVTLGLAAAFGGGFLLLLFVLKHSKPLSPPVVIVFQLALLTIGVALTFDLFRQNDPQKWMFAFLVGVCALGAARYHLKQRKARQDAAKATDTVGTGTTA
ncbi:MAG: hypothetical protein Q8J89_00300 [Caulobacter sp.]|nr:hypothetical protein [Caulobacter sp.]